MSYCVNCGVELDATATACPLCNTKIYNPNQPVATDIPTPYATVKGHTEPVKQTYEFAILMTIIFLTCIFPTERKSIWSNCFRWCHHCTKYRCCFLVASGKWMVLAYCTSDYDFNNIAFGNRAYVFLSFEEFHDRQNSHLCICNCGTLYCN